MCVCTSVHARVCILHHSVCACACVCVCVCVCFLVSFSCSHAAPLTCRAIICRGVHRQTADPPEGPDKSTASGDVPLRDSDTHEEETPGRGKQQSTEKYSFLFPLFCFD